jgi:oxygen-independent coproporphyrinogen-3 oxidase
MVDAILKEISREAYKLKGQAVETIYFGGGTPSLLTEDELGRLIETLFGNFQVSGGAEVTFEVNPDDITSESLAAWKKSGINRLSIGVQSFRDEDLSWMNRAHNAREALVAFCRPRMQVSTTLPSTSSMGHLVLMTTLGSIMFSKQ